MTSIKWHNNISAGIDAYEQHIEQRSLMLAQKLAERIETWMKANAPWQDQTGDARAGLFAVAEQASRDLINIYFSHGANIDYGIWLEIRNAGRYAVIRPALEQIAIPELQKMVQEVFQ